MEVEGDVFEWVRAFLSSRAGALDRQDQGGQKLILEDLIQSRWTGWPGRRARRRPDDIRAQFLKGHDRVVHLLRDLPVWEDHDDEPSVGSLLGLGFICELLK